VSNALPATAKNQIKKITQMEETREVITMKGTGKEI
jgi:hypothetical protein